MERRPDPTVGGENASQDHHYAETGGRTFGDLEKHKVHTRRGIVDGAVPSLYFIRLIGYEAQSPTPWALIH